MDSRTYFVTTLEPVPLPMTAGVATLEFMLLFVEKVSSSLLLIQVFFDIVK